MHFRGGLHFTISIFRILQANEKMRNARPYGCAAERRCDANKYFLRPLLHAVQSRAALKKSARFRHAVETNVPPSQIAAMPDCATESNGAKTHKHVTSTCFSSLTPSVSCPLKQTCIATHRSLWQGPFKFGQFGPRLPARRPNS